MEKKEIIKDYMINKRIDIDKVIDEFYGYVYIIVKNSKSISVSDEDMEEIISDVFLALWKNSSYLNEEMLVKPYLAGTAKNIIKNKYRTIRMDDSISNYEEKMMDITNVENLAEEQEQNDIIKETLKNMKEEEYTIFIMFYYEAKKIKEIADKLKISESKVKIVLHRVRKEIKRNLRNGGYGYGK